MGCCFSSQEQKTEEEDIHKKYQFRKTLGKGASCRVVEAFDKKDKTTKVAIKIMSKEKPVCKQLYEHEVEILSKLKHKNIVEYIGNSQDSENYFVITGLLEGGELFDRIVNPEVSITEKIAAKLIYDMLTAINYLHKQNIVHRDLKPENFVFQNDTQDSEIVLIDFGCAKVVDDKTKYNDLVGTVYYLAPELAARSERVPRTGKVLKASDVWSMGVIAYVLMTGRPPFKGRNNKEIFTRIIKDPLTFPTDIDLSDGFKDFVKKALIKNPYKRISLEDALIHPWVLGRAAAEIQLNKDVIRYLRQFNYQSKLKTAITRCLANHMSPEPEKEVKRHFERLDKDGNGFLDESELTLLLSDMGFGPKRAKVEATKMLEAADQDKNGQIDFSEFKSVWHRKLLANHDQYIGRVFAVFDDNGDGQIDASELQQVLGEDDYKIIDQMIKEVDEDDNGKISFDEFQKAMKENISNDSGNNLTGVSPGAGGFNENDLIKDDIPEDNYKNDNNNNNNNKNDEKDDEKEPENTPLNEPGSEPGS